LYFNSTWFTNYEIGAMRERGNDDIQVRVQVDHGAVALQICPFGDDKSSSEGGVHIASCAPSRLVATPLIVSSSRYGHAIEPRCRS
jgi:hypothetical protein